MTVSFGSTYSISMNKKGLKTGKKDLIKKIADQYGGIYPNNGHGTVRISVRKKFDEIVEQMLSKLGIIPDKKVPIHNVKSNQIDNALYYKGRFENLKPQIQEI